jgi:hypothetical protein
MTPDRVVVHDHERRLLPVLALYIVATEDVATLAAAHSLAGVV